MELMWLKKSMSGHKMAGLNVYHMSDMSAICGQTIVLVIAIGHL